MRSTASGFIGLALSILALAGCGTYSIPRVAAQGTTIVFPVPDSFAAGFGRALNQALPFGVVDPATLVIDPTDDPHLEDFQRGELLFALRTGPDVSSSLITYLPVRYATRVQADEASRRVLPAEGDNFFPIGTPAETGQTVAFVDVPYQTPPGIYYVFVERWKRNHPNEQEKFVKQNPIMFGSTGWLSWGGLTAWGGQTHNAGMQIRVVASSSETALFHDTTLGFDRWSVDGLYHFGDHTWELELLVPSPKLRIWIGNPAAWELTLAYPAGKFEITGATLGSLHRSGGLVSVSTAGTPSSCGGAGTARITLIDPGRKSGWVDVVYRLRDFAGCGRAVPADFTKVAGSDKAYDLDGNPVAATADIDPEYSF